MVASLSCAELGTAQPQLVDIILSQLFRLPIYRRILGFHCIESGFCKRFMALFFCQLILPFLKYNLIFFISKILMICLMFDSREFWSILIGMLNNRKFLSQHLVYLVKAKCTLCEFVSCKLFPLANHVWRHGYDKDSHKTKLSQHHLNYNTYFYIR